MYKELIILGFLTFCSASDVFDRFESWISTHRMEFKDNSQIAHVFKNWVFNDDYIQQINGANLTWVASHNAWSGMSLDEFVEYMRMDNKLIGDLFPSFGSLNEPEQLSALPTTWDWRTKGVVSQIRDQGQCGSCWAFSGTSTLESAIAIKTGVLNDLSEQQGVDCSTVKEGWKNMGCNGGWYYDLWDYVKSNGGLTSESCYPYTSGVTKSTVTCKKT